MRVIPVLDLKHGRAVQARSGRRERYAPQHELLGSIGRLGGVGSVSDIERAADAGLDGVLVASALHDGRVAAAELEAVRCRGAGAPRRGRHASDSR